MVPLNLLLTRESIPFCFLHEERLIRRNPFDWWRAKALVRFFTIFGFESGAIFVISNPAYYWRWLERIRDIKLDESFLWIHQFYCAVAAFLPAFWWVLYISFYSRVLYLAFKPSRTTENRISLAGAKYVYPYSLYNSSVRLKILGRSTVLDSIAQCDAYSKNINWAIEDWFDTISPVTFSLISASP
jgi:hypothetical protein